MDFNSKTQLDRAYQNRDAPLDTFSHNKSTPRPDEPDEVQALSFTTRSPNGHPVVIKRLVKRDGQWFAQSSVATWHYEFPVRWQ